jgi:formyltetrahydrofolate-dependent phosphoribosylglycinamide formyltransferase
MRRRTAVMISGRGSNMAALLAAARSPDYPAEIVLVLSNEREAPGLAIATRWGITAQAIDHRPYRKDRAAHEAALATMLDGSGVEIVCLAGYMRLLTPFLVKKYRGRMLNIHPSLLPAFPGLHTHERALAAGVKLHGATVHLVSEKTDDGPILAQAAVPVLPGDDANTLAARVLVQEHRIYPSALRVLASGIGNGGVVPTVAPEAGAVLANPLPYVPPPSLPSPVPLP